MSTVDNQMCTVAEHPTDRFFPLDDHQGYRMCSVIALQIERQNKAIYNLQVSAFQFFAHVRRWIWICIKALSSILCPRISEAQFVHVCINLYLVNLCDRTCISNIHMLIHSTWSLVSRITVGFLFLDLDIAREQSSQQTGDRDNAGGFQLWRLLQQIWKGRVDGAWSPIVTLRIVGCLAAVMPSLQHWNQNNMRKSRDEATFEWPVSQFHK